MISVSAKMNYQEVRENSMRSGKSQGKRRSNKSGHPVVTSTSMRFMGNTGFSYFLFVETTVVICISPSFGRQNYQGYEE